MTPAPPASAGYLSSLRLLGDNVLSSFEERLKLFSIELHEEKFRLIQTFIWISAAVFTAVMSVTFASFTLVYLCRESARLTALSVLTVLYSGAFVAIIVAFRRYLARQPSPFAATLHEIGQDRACIHNKS